MTPARPLALAWLALLLGCSARTSLSNEVGESVGDPSASAGAGGASCEPDGVRLCGAPCPDPAAIPDCPGDGCTPVAQRDSLVATDMGLCWPDLNDWVNAPCIACREGEVCVHRADGGLWCVPRGVCDALYAFGEVDVCRYVDKTPYTGAPLAGAPGCLDGVALCGGGCGPCVPGDHCAGRSASQAFGICVNSLISDPTQCSPTLPNLRDACHPDLELCAAFITEPEDQALANEYGICVDRDRCLIAAGAGILRCFDGAGSRVDP